MASTHTFTRKQEYANAASHALGAIFSLVALVVLIVFATRQGNTWDVVSFTIFGSTMLLLYMSSTLLHILPQGRAKDIFEILDHSAIYLFIAGTYTPILLILVGGWRGWTLLIGIWVIAAGGIVFKSFHVKKFVILSTIGYIMMGWMAVLVLDPIIHVLPLHGILLLFGGGLFYTIGSAFYVWRKLTYHHTIWHLFVLAGSVCHFILILVYVLPIH